MNSTLIKPMAVDRVHETVLKIIDIQNGRALDAAAGQGAISLKLLELGFDVHAADINPRYFKAEGVKFLQLDLNNKLPYGDNFFDLITSVETIEHLHNPWGCLREFHRVLKDDGTLILSTPNVLTIFSRILFLLRGRFAGFLDVDFQESGHISPIPLWQLEKMANQIGFTIQTIEFNRGYIPIIRVEIPIKNIHTGQILIVKMKKK